VGLAFCKISSSKKDRTPIDCIKWNDDGRFIYSAAKETVKVWDLEQAILNDNIVSKYPGVLDMAISKTNQVLLGITSSSNHFGLWAVKLKDINTSG
jgi:katanin p80 WD40 repeat-containing subunit B1